MAKINFDGTVEEVVTYKEFSRSKAKKVLQNETVAILGYGVMGSSLSLNLRDSGIHVIVGQRQKTQSYSKAINDGWTPHKTLFPLDIAASHASIIIYMLSDAGQKEYWSNLKPFLTAGKTLVFAHGFSITYKKLTGVIPPPDIDVVLVAPYALGAAVRQNYLHHSGINTSVSVYQDATGRGFEKATSIGIAIGSHNIFSTTFEKETYSDLVAERGILVGALSGLMKAQYDVLRKHGHSPSEAYNNTVEELTQSLLKLVGDNGMDWVMANISPTAKRGALDWNEKFRRAVAPVFNELYKNVKNGSEAKKVIATHNEANYKTALRKEIDVFGNTEIWRVGKIIHKLRSGKNK